MQVPNQAKEEIETIAHIIDLIEVIIWPLTLIIVVVLFKKNITGIIGRIGSIQAGPTGFSLTFQKKIDEIKKYFPASASNSNNDGSKSKSSVKIPGRRKTSIKGQTPYHTLMAIRDALNNEIIHKAQQHKIDPKNLTSIEISEKLKSIGALTIQKTKGFQALIELTNAADSSISQEQVDQVNQLYENLNL